jgi:hypothetical protein
MDDDTLFAILNKRIKEFKCQKKVEKMEADFALTLDKFKGIKRCCG